MRFVRRIVVGVLGLALLMSGALGWRAVQLQRERDRRATDLKAQLPRLRAAESLSDADACLLAEAHYLEHEHALVTSCRNVTLEPTNPGVVKFTGLRHARQWKDALLGMVRVPTLCLAKGPEGWSVAGESYRLAECDFAAPTGAESPEEQVARAMDKGDTRAERTATEALEARQAWLAEAEHTLAEFTG